MRLALARPLLLGLAALSGAQAQVAEDPWYVGASLGLTKVSNLYRSSDEQARNDDTVRTATLLGGAQARLGRQRVKVDARVSQNDYRKNSDLGNLSYSGDLGFDWSLGSRLNGSLVAGSQRNLAPFNPGNAPVTTQKNIERNDRVRFGLRYGLRGLWSVDAAVSANRRDYSIALYDPYDYSQRGADLGLRWQPGAELNLRLGFREARGRYPRFRPLAGGGYQADRFTRRDLDASLGWTPSIEHSLNLRISQGKSEHTDAGARNFEGINGRLGWLWAPTSRLQFQTTLSRDTGDDTRSIDLGIITLNSVNSRVYDSLQWQAVYAISAKVSVDLSLSETRRELADSFASRTVVGKDRTRAAGIGARWAFDRNGSFGCQWNTDSRNGAAGFSLPYKASSVGCSLQYMVR